jgi:putative two-component system response regulator
MPHNLLESPPFTPSCQQGEIVVPSAAREIEIITAEDARGATDNQLGVLVVEDDCISAELLANSLDYFGYSVTVVESGGQAFELVRTGDFRMVVSGWEMPEMNGAELCRKIRQRDWSKYIYFVLLTSHNELEHIVEGLKAGADDFLTKPFQVEELRARLRTGERVLSLESRDVMLFTLAKLTESRDIETGMHLERMREYCRILADELSGWDKYAAEIDGEYVQLLYLTSPLHDIGKVGIPDKVLLKPGRLTPDEFEIMKLHTTIGGETLAAATKAHAHARFLTMARDIAFTHHERFDGKGYPLGLTGTDIPLCGRLTAVADVYDALTTKRVYKPKFAHEHARGIVEQGSGTQFDPDVVTAFFRREREITQVARSLDAQSAASLPIPAMKAALA